MPNFFMPYAILSALVFLASCSTPDETITVEIPEEAGLELCRGEAFVCSKQISFLRTLLELQDDFIAHIRAQRDDALRNSAICSDYMELMGPPSP